jgi:ureidoacrylate peracid hydrolase
MPCILRFIDAARQPGADFRQAIWPHVLSAPMRELNARLNMELPRCLSGSWGAEFYQVKPLPGEPVIIKHRYSAMVGTPLLDLLEQRGIRSLLLTGVATDTCVESAGRDAYSDASRSAQLEQQRPRGRSVAGIGLSKIRDVNA